MLSMLRRTAQQTAPAAKGERHWTGHPQAVPDTLHPSTQAAAPSWSARPAAAKQTGRSAPPYGGDQTTPAAACPAPTVPRLTPSRPAGSPGAAPHTTCSMGMAAVPPPATCQLSLTGDTVPSAATRVGGFAPLAAPEAAAMTAGCHQQTLNPRDLAALHSMNQVPRASWQCRE